MSRDATGARAQRETQRAIDGADGAQEDSTHPPSRSAPPPPARTTTNTTIADLPYALPATAHPPHVPDRSVQLTRWTHLKAPPKAAVRRDYKPKSVKMPIPHCELPAPGTLVYNTEANVLKVPYVTPGSMRLVYHYFDITGRYFRSYEKFLKSPPAVYHGPPGSAPSAPEEPLAGADDGGGAADGGDGGDGGGGDDDDVVADDEMLDDECAEEGADAEIGDMADEAMADEPIADEAMADEAVADEAMACEATTKLSTAAAALAETDAGMAIASPAEASTGAASGSPDDRGADSVPSMKSVEAASLPRELRRPPRTAADDALARRVLPLLHSIFAYVSRTGSSTIDWEAVVAGMGDATATAAEPALTAAEACKLWRNLAYGRGSPNYRAGDGSGEGEVEEWAQAWRALSQRIAAATTAAAASALDEGVDSDVEEYLRNERRREDAAPVTFASSRKRVADSTRRMPGLPFPTPPGVWRPTLPADGAGPLDLGLEPPLKKKPRGDDDEKHISIDDAIRLASSSQTYTTRPWDDNEDRKLANAVKKHGHRNQEALVRTMRGRTWASLEKRIKLLVDKGMVDKPEPQKAAERLATGLGRSKALRAPNRGRERKRKPKEAKAADEEALASAAAASSSGAKSEAAEGAAESKAAKPPKPPKPTRVGKAASKALVRRLIEVYWDGNEEWYECEVLAYDETSKKHSVRYTADEYGCEEDLSAVCWRGPLKRDRAKPRLGA